ASGAYATVPGGRGNTASGNYAFATGRRAQATHEGSFVWGDATDADVASSAPNQTTFRSTGGFRIFTNTALSTGVQVPAGGNSWASISDRALKDNLTPVDGQDVLRRLLGVPVYTYTLKSQDPSVKHMGPVAQDFARAFGLGEDERYIGSANADGVLMAALQGLALRLQEREAELARQKEEMDALKARLGTLEALVAALLTTSQRP
ncbi:MAG: tail fiber domain-containing protein, partial [Chloroflexota bacterium]|nr:tail fiber domain-containing protein [Chloroflexota bacterium]